MQTPRQTTVKLVQDSWPGSWENLVLGKFKGK